MNAAGEAGGGTCENPDCSNDSAMTCDECGRRFCLAHSQHPDHISSAE